MDYVNTLYEEVTTSLSSITAKLMLDQAFNKEYYTTNTAPGVEEAFMSTLYREEECPYYFTEYDDFITLYTDNDFKEILGINIIEFLELTRFQVQMLLTHVKEVQKKINTKHNALFDSVGKG